ncbi:hypothetical protein [Aureivirga sp. CE67]|uniref:hypothetical protein n=1 Tax=Aureivirga sp. CE67 TaxID=1788983 RepID=UPI0018CB1046|nr:hypothetical protein [Aureivirga sp. CE67]
MEKFNLETANFKTELELKEIDTITIDFKLKLESNSDSELNLLINDKAINPDPEGMGSLDFLDLSGDYNPLEMFVFDYEEKKILILKPLVELEEEYVILKIMNENDDDLVYEMVFKN